MTTLLIGVYRLSSMFQVHSRRMCMWFHSDLAKLCVASVICICVLPMGVARGSGPTTVRLGFVNLETAKASANSDEPDAFIGGVIVRFFDLPTGRELFAITDDHGTALVPLRSGSYCAEAYGTNGIKLRLDTRLNKGKPVCFVLHPEEIKDVGVTIAQDENYKPVLPSRGLKDPPLSDWKDQ